MGPFLPCLPETATASTTWVQNEVLHQVVSGDVVGVTRIPRIQMQGRRCHYMFDDGMNFRVIFSLDQKVYKF